ncbi:MAG: RNA methyltransferase [Bacteroidetes bacterium]|nr:RNA methyltransferase [Bacteroidota bacterium]
MKRQLPSALLHSLENTTGFDKIKFAEVHDNAEQITSVRFNPKKYGRFSGKQISHPLYQLNTPVSWCSYGYYLNQRPQFTLDPLLHAGAYYVQDASSMFLWEVLQQQFDVNSNTRILDLCAAPGGKTTLLASYFKNALIISNEIIKSRTNILYENVTKWGDDAVIVTNNDPADFKRLPAYFDAVIVDAPCSGSGLFRKDADAIDEWSLNNVELCSQRQKRILADVLPSLKDKGLLIYSTCSYSQQEDEDMADWLIENFHCSSIRLDIKNFNGITETFSEKQNAAGYRFWPDKIKGEGFFICVLQKHNSNSKNLKPNNTSLSILKSKETINLQQYIHEDGYVFFKQQDMIRAVKKEFTGDIALLQKNLYLKKAGILLGEMKGNTLIPNHELAVSLIVSNDIFRIELDEHQALQYLRKKEMFINTDKKGWALCTFLGFPLGWIKILHNRVNNYYLTDWRIRKG